MNLRQTQRALADVVTKCQELHVQLPVDPFESLQSAGEALGHARVGGKMRVEDAVDEVRQRYGLEPKYQQMEDAQKSRRSKRKRLRRGDGKRIRQARSTGSGTESAGSKATSSESEAKQSTRVRKVSSAISTTSASSSQIDKIIANNPARNPANEELAEEFVELGGLELEHGRTQQGVSRMAVAKQIRLAEEPITSGAAARKLPHVGPSAAAKIDEVLHHGKMRALEAYEAEKEEEEEGERHNATSTGEDGDDEHEEEDAEDEEEEEEEEEEDPNDADYLDEA